MARQNDVWLYGCVGNEPMIIRDLQTQEYVRGDYFLNVMRSAKRDRRTQTEADDNKALDWPMILSNDAKMISFMEKLKMFDIVEIRGKFVTRKMRKKTNCKFCGGAVIMPGNINFVMPVDMKIRSGRKNQLTSKQAFQEVADNREFSNSIIIAGNLCTDVNYYKDDKVETSTYQIATDRRLFVKGDPSDVKTDFPIIRSFGVQARQDGLCLHKGSSVIINGYLHTRDFKRTAVCPSCGKEFTWEDSTTEIIPYSVDYTSNYTDPEEAQRLREENPELNDFV